MPGYGDTIAKGVRSADPTLPPSNPDFPFSFLPSSIFPKTNYVEHASPGLQQFKLTHFGHDMVVLHEHDMRKSAGAFSILLSETKRTAFMKDLSHLIAGIDFTIIACVIRKERLRQQYSSPNTVHQ